MVESTLGLNDYLTTAVPNLHEVAQHSATKGTGRGIRSHQKEAECQGEQRRRGATGCTKKNQHGTGVQREALKKKSTG